MTEILIDNTRVVLPPEFSQEIIKENPFVTKAGTFTLDLVLDLESTINVKLYKNYNRQNNTEPIATGRNAKIIVDNETILDGTEIIMEITDQQVKLQLVSGESELNFLIGGDKKINELDLGQFTGANSTTIFPIISKNQRWTDDDWVLNRQRIIRNTDGSLSVIPDALIFTYQIKFNILVKNILEKIGYTVTYSFLDSEPFKFIYIINGLFASKIEEKLPNWTINEFFEEIEKLFNCCFLIDEFTKNVSIKLKYDFYEESNKIEIKTVLDAYEQKIDEENRDSYAIANIGYNLEDDDYFKFQNLIQELLDIAGEPIHMASYESISTYMNASSTDKIALKGKIFIADNTNTWYVAWLMDDDITYQPKKVNILRPIKNNPQKPDLDIELKITPAPMKLFKIPVTNYILLNPIIYFYMISQAPVTETNYIVPGEGDNSDSQLDIQDYLNNGNLDFNKKTDTDKMQIAFYSGYHPIFAENEYIGQQLVSVDYPVAFVDYLKEDDRTNGAIDPQHPNLSFRLDDPYGLKTLYQQTKPVDTTREYTYKFINQPKLDVKNIFVINNKEYICKQLKFTVNLNGFDKIVEGKFYPVD